MSADLDPDLLWKSQILGMKVVVTAMLMSAFRTSEDPAAAARQFANSIALTIENLPLTSSTDEEREAHRTAIRDRAFEMIESATNIGTEHLQSSRPQ